MMTRLICLKLNNKQMPSTLYFIIEPSVRMVLLDLCLWKSFCSDAVCKNKTKHAVSKKLKAKLYKKKKKYRCLNIWRFIILMKILFVNLLCICFSCDTAVLSTHQHVKVCTYLWDQNGICHHHLHGLMSN